MPRAYDGVISKTFDDVSLVRYATSAGVILTGATLDGVKAEIEFHVDDHGDVGWTITTLTVPVSGGSSYDLATKTFNPGIDTDALIETSDPLHVLILKAISETYGQDIEDACRDAASDDGWSIPDDYAEHGTYRAGAL